MIGQDGLRIGIDLGGSKIEGILISLEAKESARYRVATPRNNYAATIAAIVDLRTRHAGHPEWCQDRYRRPRVHLARHWTDAKCQFNLAQRPPLRPRPSSCACDAGATRQRRQLLRLVRGHRWCGGERANCVRGYPGNWMRRWSSRKWQATRRTAWHRRRMGSQSASLAHIPGTPRTPLLVRTQRVPGNMGFGPRLGCRSCQGNGR